MVWARPELNFGLRTYAGVNMSKPRAAASFSKRRSLGENDQRRARPGGVEYPQVRAGLILTMDQTFSVENSRIVEEKAIPCG
jgi:hypothetical protein